MLVIALLALLATVTSEPFCVPPCICHQSGFTRVTPPRNTFHLSCFMEDEGSLPDWSLLGQHAGDISISLQFQTPGPFRKSYLPSGYNVLGLEVKGAQSVDPDALENIQHSVEYLELGKLAMETTWSMPFLSKLVSLQKLILEYDSHGPEPVHVTGTPFKDHGLTLSKLSFHGGNIASLGPDIFEGLSAQHVYIGNNGFTAFPWQAFRKIQNLKKLEIYSNPMPHIEDGALDGLALEHLEVVGTLTESISAQAFHGAAATLKTLIVKRTKLKDLPAEALAPLRSLKTLDLEENPFDNITQPLQGSVCPENLRLGGVAVGSNNLSWIHPDTFKAAGSCIRHLSMTYTALDEFPTEALRDLDSVGSILIDSSAMTALRPGALSGVGTRVLNLWAPLEAIEPGAFDDMKHYPVALSLTTTKLSNLGFFYDYPGKTFASISVTSTALQCDCELAGVRRNLNARKGREWKPYTDDLLWGSCFLDGAQVSMRSQEFFDTYSNCTNTTMLNLRVTGCGGTLRGSAVLLFALWVAPLWGPWE